jgi:hypothetical protein
MPRLIEKRSCHWSIYINGVIYVFGGTNLTNSEKLDSTTGRNTLYWVEIINQIPFDEIPDYY